MATIPAISLIRRASTRVGLLALLLVAALAAGCLTTENGGGFWKVERPTDVCPHQMVCVWQNNVLQVPDTTRGGQPMVGMAGRVYFFGEQLDFPKLCCGALGVSVFDESSGKPIMIDHVEVDPETLKRLSKKDFLGEGYSIFIPLPKYKEDMSKLRLRTAFKAKTRSNRMSDGLLAANPPDTPVGT